MGFGLVEMERPLVDLDKIALHFKHTFTIDATFPAKYAGKSAAAPGTRECIFVNNCCTYLSFNDYAD